MSESPLPDTDDGRHDYVHIRPRIVYRPQEGNGEKALLRWILGIVSTLFVSGLIGYWNQTIQLAEVRTEVRNLKEQFAELKRLVEPRYRSRQHQE